MKPIVCKALGESALIINFEQQISLEIYAAVDSIAFALQKAKMVGVEAVIPAYCSLLIRFNPLILSFDDVRYFVEQHADFGQNSEETSKFEVYPIEIPVCYTDEFALDKEAVMRYTSLSWPEVIANHTSKDYTVFMLGFVPGFGYLGPLDDVLFCPRKAVPDKNIPRGSVAIAGNQTAIYPSETPGGWQVIGRTPLAVFDATAHQPILLKPGQKVVFKSITPQEYDALLQTLNSK